MSVLSYLNLEAPARKPVLIVYTDGSCFNNGRKGKAVGGLGVVFPEYPDLNLSESLAGTQATNNRAELLAIIRALQIIEQKIDKTNLLTVHIKTDSMLCMRTVNEWMRGWKSRGWKKADGNTPKNLDLLKSLDALLSKRKKVSLEHVRAHTGRRDSESLYNALADQLARDASKIPKHNNITYC